MRNIPGGALPWVLTSIAARVNEGGQITADVVGLVFAAGTPFAGTVGPITHHAATQSCPDDGGTIDNLTTPGVPVSTTRDVTIEDRVTLPAACLAPVLLVRAFNPGTGTAGPWFAVSGF